MVLGSKDSFSEEVCYCNHQCCYLTDMADYSIIEYERWSCYDCSCHYKLDDHPLYEEYLHEKWGKED